MTKYIGPKTDGANVATQSDVGGSSLSDATPDALTPDQAGAAGTASSAARADHAHEILCAAAGAILPDDAAAEGTASSFARSDHTHAITTAAPGTILPDDAAATGTSASLARADHTHAIAAAAASTLTGASNAEGTSTSFARADHTHAISLPRCRATGTSQSNANFVETALSLSAEDFDTDAFHSTSSNTSRLTIPSGLGGDYLLIGNATFTTNSTGWRRLRFRKNGTTILNEEGAEVAGSLAEIRLSASIMVALVATDYVELMAFHAIDPGANLTVTNYSFQLVRLG